MAREPLSVDELRLVMAGAIPNWILDGIDGDKKAETECLDWFRKEVELKGVGLVNSVFGPFFGLGLWKGVSFAVVAVAIYRF